MKNTRLSTKLGGYKHYWLQKTEQNRPFWATSKNQTAVLVRQIELNDIPYINKILEMEKKNNIDRTSLSTALVLFVFTRPYFFWGLLSNTFIKLIFNIVIGVLLYRQLKKLTSYDYRLIFLYELTFLLYAFLKLLHGSNIFGIIEVLPISLFVCACLMNQYSMQKVGDYFINIVITISTFGFILFILSGFGIPLPSFGTIRHFVEERSYTVYPLYLKENFDWYRTVRFQSVFDEPGVLGTLLSFIFVIKKGNFKDWRVWASLIVGIFTFSFFFYSILVIYGIVKLFSLKTKKTSTVFLIILFSGFFLLTRNDPEMKTLMWERFEWDSQNNQFKGDDRITEKGDMAYNKLKGTTAYWWGLNKSEKETFMDDYEGSSSYKGIVAYNGMVFFVLYVFFFVMLGWKYKCSNIDFILYLLIVVLCLYQRTNVYSVVYLFLYGLMARSRLYGGSVDEK